MIYPFLKTVFYVKYLRSYGVQYAPSGWGLYIRSDLMTKKQERSNDIYTWARYRPAPTCLEKMPSLKACLIHVLLALYGPPLKYCQFHSSFSLRHRTSNLTSPCLGYTHFHKRPASLPFPVPLPSSFDFHRRIPSWYIVATWTPPGLQILV